MSEQKELYEKLDHVIQKYQSVQGALMPVLQAAQELFGCVPYKVQAHVAKGLGVTLSEVYGVATFYSQFALEPKGKHVIGVCMGTACYVKGSQKVLDALAEALKMPVGATSPDGKFTLNATRCLGCCGLAPVMMIGDDVYGRLTPDKIPEILAKY